MGLKFYGSGTTSVIPANSSLGIRELGLNWTDGKIFTSTDGTDIVEVTSNRGVDYKTTTTYAIGDVVSYDDNLWIAKSPVLATVPGTTGQWIKVSSTTSSAHDPSAQYAEGDTVIVDGVLYVAPVGGETVNVPPAGGWIVVSKPEVGGISWSVPVNYVLGDVVSDSGSLWICVNPHTSAAGDISDGQPNQPLQTGWVMAHSDATELGGVEYNSGYTYSIGDIVTGTDGKTFRALTSSTGAILPGSGIDSTTDWTNDIIVDPGTY